MHGRRRARPERKNMKKKLLIMSVAMVLVCAFAVGMTIAYLTSTDKVVNTFTVGNVQIKLDEAEVDQYGVPQGSPAPRISENVYKLIPGHTYTKDPMVTVLSGSERSYIKMTVTVTKSAELDAIFGNGGANLLSIFNGYDSANWTYKGNTENTGNNTRTYEFWYKEAVAAPTANVELDPLFDSITVPDTITNTQLGTIEGMKITVNAYAIQADGFDNAADAWAAYNAN